MVKDSAYRIKSVSVDAVVACLLSGLSICCMAGAVYFSYTRNGNGPVAVGLLGIASLLLASLGIVFTISAWKSSDGGVGLKRIAGIVNAIPVIVAIFLYILGWV